MERGVSYNKFNFKKSKKLSSQFNNKYYNSPNKTDSGVFMLKKDALLKNLFDKNRGHSQNNYDELLNLKHIKYYGTEKEFYFAKNEDFNLKLDDALSIRKISERNLCTSKSNFNQTPFQKYRKIDYVTKEIKSHTLRKNSTVKNFQQLRVKFPKFLFKAKSLYNYNIKSEGQFNSFVDTNMKKFNRELSANLNIKSYHKEFDKTKNHNATKLLTNYKKDANIYVHLNTHTSNNSFNSFNYFSNFLNTKESTTQTPNVVNSNIIYKELLKSKLKNLLIKESLILDKKIDKRFPNNTEKASKVLITQHNFNYKNNFKTEMNEIDKI